MVSAGAIGVIWGEGRAGKIPEQMVGHLGSDSFDQAVPVCAMEKADFDAFTDAGYFTAGQVTSIDTTNIPMYREQDERISEPRITYLTVEEPWKPGGPNGYAFPMPAKTATFGPTAAVATEDELVEAVFVSACRSDAYEACAVNCWARVASGTLNPFTQSLTGKIALFASAGEDEDEATPTTVLPHFSSWAKLAQDAGAVAIVHGTRGVSSWYYAGPCKSSTYHPFFSLMRRTGTEHARRVGGARVAAWLQAPVIAGGAGPDFFADADVDFGLAPVLVARRHDHFYCDAGRAVFNPHPGRVCRFLARRPPSRRTRRGGDRGGRRAARAWWAARPRRSGSSGRASASSINASATVMRRGGESSDVPSAWPFGEDFIAVVFLVDFVLHVDASTPPSRAAGAARRCLLSPTRRTRAACTPSWTSPAASLRAAHLFGDVRVRERWRLTADTAASSRLGRRRPLRLPPAEHIVPIPGDVHGGDRVYC